MRRFKTQDGTFVVQFEYHPQQLAEHDKVSRDLLQLHAAIAHILNARASAEKDEDSIHDSSRPVSAIHVSEATASRFWALDLASRLRMV